MPRSRRIVAVVYQDVQLLDFAGPLDVFGTANRVVPGVNYQLVVASQAGGRIGTSSSVSVDSVRLASIRGPIDTLLVAGGVGTRAALEDGELLRTLRRLAARADRVTSVCSGAFLLAAAGVLDGHRATTHWQWCDLLGQSFPNVEVDPEPIYIRSGKVWTSAGDTCGIDLSLALLGEDHGADAATEVARQLVMYVHRSGGQSQFSTHLVVQPMKSGAMTDVMEWIAAHLDADLSVAALAGRSNQSPRHFARVFKAATGSTPGDHVERLRLELARRLLETTELSLPHIAHACGFGTVETMHRTFRRRLQTTPTSHRRHFAATSRSTDR